MAWNGSNSANVTKPDARRTTPDAQSTLHKAQGMRHGIYAGAIVVALGGAALWFFTRPAPPPTAQDTKPKTQGTIATATPARAGTNRVEAATTSVAKKARPPRKTYRDEKGVLRYEGGMVVRKPPVRTIKVGDHTPSIFKHVAEMQIQGLLEIEPGSMVAGTMDYGKHFTESLKESFKDEIVINPDDDERTREIKQAVIDTKKELKERMENGEDVGKLMSDTRKDLQRLGMYRMELENEVRKVLNERAENDELSDQDVKDCFGAANKMLEEKGIAPLNMPGKMFVRSMRRSALAAKKQREEQSKGTKK